MKTRAGQKAGKESPDNSVAGEPSSFEGGLKQIVSSLARALNKNQGYLADAKKKLTFDGANITKFLIDYENLAALPKWTEEEKMDHLGQHVSLSLGRDIMVIVAESRSWKETRDVMMRKYIAEEKMATEVDLAAIQSKSFATYNDFLREFTLVALRIPGVTDRIMSKYFLRQFSEFDKDKILSAYQQTSKFVNTRDVDFSTVMDLAEKTVVTETLALLKEGEIIDLTGRTGDKKKKGIESLHEWVHGADNKIERMEGALLVMQAQVSRPALPPQEAVVPPGVANRGFRRRDLANEQCKYCTAIGHYVRAYPKLNHDILKRRCIRSLKGGIFGPQGERVNWNSPGGMRRAIIMLNELEITAVEAEPVGEIIWDQLRGRKPQTNFILESDGRDRVNTTTRLGTAGRRINRDTIIEEVAGSSEPQAEPEAEEPEKVYVKPMKEEPADKATAAKKKFRYQIPILTLPELDDTISKLLGTMVSVSFQTMLQASSRFLKGLRQLLTRRRVEIGDNPEVPEGVREEEAPQEVTNLQRSHGDLEDLEKVFADIRLSLSDREGGEVMRSPPGTKLSFQALPVGKLEIQIGNRHTDALVDGGAQITLIRRDFATITGCTVNKEVTGSIRGASGEIPFAGRSNRPPPSEDELLRCGAYDIAITNRWFVFRKPNKTLRWIHDLQKLNAVTIRDVGSLPQADLLAKSHASRSIYSLIDLYSGYDQLPLDVRDRPYTAMHTPVGQLQMQVTPMGFTNAVVEAQRRMLAVAGDMFPEKCEPYIDDNPIKGVQEKDETEVQPGIRRFVWDHLQDIKDLLRRFLVYNITVSGPKSILAVPEVTILGFRCDTTSHDDGERRYSQFKKEVLVILHCLKTFQAYLFGRRFILRIDPTNVAGDLKNYRPIDPTVGRWVGFIWQFDYKIERIAGIRNKAYGLSRVCITSEGMEDAEPIDAFLEYEGGTLAVDNEMMSGECTSEELLIHTLEKGAPAVVAELTEGPVTTRGHKEENDSWGAIVGPREELIAMVVEGGREAVMSLVESWERKELQWVVNQMREGKDGGKEGEEFFYVQSYEGLFREIGLLLVGNKQPTKVSIKAREEAERYVLRGEHLFRREEGAMPRRVVCGRSRQVDVIKAMHDGLAGGHRSSKGTLAKITPLYYWSGMAGMVAISYQTCLICQEQSSVRVFEPLRPMRVLGPGHLVHLDLAVVPISTDGYRYILDARDNFSGFVEAVALKKKTGRSVADWIENFYLRHPFVRRFIADNEMEFVNQKVLGMLKRLCVPIKLIEPYHPEANAPVEREHRTLKNTIAKLAADHLGNWPRYLKQAVFADNMTPKRTTGCIPTDLWYGREIDFPVEALVPT
ncbi:hypothetical protein CBR_g12611 [Chara braunii]|uniref:Integrase catalytic domain-containing protein n=1 Tax=Chara braunii TaxID=69332 RepID=A0A388KS52_CHABU|nr:hypothetical protein CBR_g12611 [Chara braunii]|eukprot:GBG72891.1 hypothetical protein CBR_g12611 [Chara braunii]